MSKKTYTIRTDVLDTAFADPDQAALAAAREALEGADSIDIEVTRDSGRRYVVGYEVTPETIAAARCFRCAVREFWRQLRPVCHAGS